MQIVTAPSKISQVTDALRQEIKQGKYQVGDKLSGVRELSERFGVSSRIISLALEKLSTEKLVVRKHSKGIFVADWRRADVSEVYFLHWAKYNCGSSYIKKLMEMTYPPYLREGFHFTIRSVFDARLDSDHLIREIANIGSLCGLDCLLINGTGLDRNAVAMLEKLSIPVIFLGDFHLEEIARMDLNQITEDSYRNGYQGVKFIRSQGFDEMRLIQPLGNYYYKRFYAGAMQAAKEIGIKLDFYEIPYVGDYEKDDYEEVLCESLKHYFSEMTGSLPVLAFGVGEEMKSLLPECYHDGSCPWFVPVWNSDYMQEYYNTVFDNIEKLRNGKEKIGKQIVELPLLMKDIWTGTQWVNGDILGR